MSFLSDITTLILSKQIQTKADLHREKIRLCKTYGLSTIPRDSEILAQLPEDVSEEERIVALSLLRKKPTRTISGVAIVAVMTSPEACPHGRCVPCPGGPTNNTPQSYTGYEPAAMRALFHQFDPYLQTTNRLEQLQAIGHAVDKIDFIVMGGTLTSRHPVYQEWFMKRCYDALNGKPSKTLLQAQTLNETARSRCIGLTMETRPDWFRIQHIDEGLRFGATRVELGVQTVDDELLYSMKRGHTVSDSIFATELAKNAGFKVCYHLMPGLPGSSPEKDIEMFTTVFEDARFQPDMIKIYPTVIVKGTELYTLWEQRKYIPYTTEQVVRLISDIKEHVPEYVRIQRIQRDIPIPHISAGLRKGNIRELVHSELQKRNHRCRCIRCREIGHQSLKEQISMNPDDLVFCRRQYEASRSLEVFLSLENRHYDVILGYLRLRDIICSHRPELVDKPCMIIRELKVLGQEVSLGEKSPSAIQHKGFGNELLAEAERICSEEFQKHSLFVLSGVGVRPYYRRLGYHDNGRYLHKTV